MNTSDTSYFTLAEIAEIEKDALEQQELRKPNFVNPFGRTANSISNISEKYGLILIKGNKNTGFEHILLRHEHFSRTPFWVEQNGSKYLDNPTRLSPNSVPIMDYVKIADKIYATRNINLISCKNPTLYDMYSGVIEYYGANRLFHLLLYKNSKVIHTLYPEETVEKKDKPSRFHFFKGRVTGQHFLTEDVILIRIPYLDANNKVVYSANLFNDYRSKLQKAVIIKHNLEGEKERYSEIGEKPINIHRDLPFLIIHYQAADLRDIEECIKKMDAYLKSENK